MWLLLLMHFQFAGEGQPMNEVVVAEHAIYEKFDDCIHNALKYNQLVSSQKSSAVCVKAEVFYPGIKKTSDLAF